MPCAYIFPSLVIPAKAGIHVVAVRTTFSLHNPRNHRAAPSHGCHLPWHGMTNESALHDHSTLIRHSSESWNPCRSGLQMILSAILLESPTSPSARPSVSNPATSLQQFLDSIFYVVGTSVAGSHDFQSCLCVASIEEV